MDDCCCCCYCNYLEEFGIVAADEKVFDGGFGGLRSPFVFRVSARGISGRGRTREISERMRGSGSRDK